MIQLEGITDEKYSLINGNIFFKTKDGKEYYLTQQECLKLVYTLYDSLNLPYTEPDKLDQIINPE